MAIFPRDIYTAVKTALSESDELTYVDTFAIQKYLRDNIPDFTYYAIIVSPMAARSHIYEAAQRYIGTDIELVLLAKMLDRTEEDVVLADSPEASPPNVGILAMYEDVYRTLYKNTLGGTIELYPKINELDNVSQFDVFAGDEFREDFLIEARVRYSPRGQRFVDLA